MDRDTYQKSPNLGPISLPFRDAKQAKALDEEDAFMHRHGGWPARCISFIVETFTGFHSAIKKAPPNE
jgi:hypothetical protein